MIQLYMIVSITNTNLFNLISFANNIRNMTIILNMWSFARNLILYHIVSEASPMQNNEISTYNIVLRVMSF